MRFSIWSVVWYLLTIVWAGGYQGALERVFMYQAYLIDTKLNAANDQIMGWQCKGASFDTKTKTCTGSWTRTPGHTGNQPITYDKFVGSLGKVPGGRKWSEFDNGSLDIEKTAKKTYDEFMKVQPGQDPTKAKVTNFGANTFMRDTVEWNDCIQKAGKMVERTYRAKKTTLTDEQKKLFEDFDKATNLVLNARVGDHGAHLIQLAQDKLNTDGITVRTKNVGTNPVTSGTSWDTVDWKETIKQAEDAGIADAKKKVQAAAKSIYTSDKSAREHKTVIDSYRRTEDRKPNCGRA